MLTLQSIIYVNTADETQMLINNGAVSRYRLHDN